MRNWKRNRHTKGKGGAKIIKILTLDVARNMEAPCSQHLHTSMK